MIASNNDNIGDGIDDNDDATSSNVQSSSDSINGGDSDSMLE